MTKRHAIRIAKAINRISGGLSIRFLRWVLTVDQCTALMLLQLSLNQVKHKENSGE